MEPQQREGEGDGMEGRRGTRERVLWRGLEETVDLKKGLGGERVERIERSEREEICEGILTLLGGKEEIVGGVRKWVVREIKERDRGCRETTDGEIEII